MDSDMIDGDDRSSSLSDIEDEGESPDEENLIQVDPPTEADSEAETERVDNTPNKTGGSKKMVLNTMPFELSPSKLALTTGAESGDDEDSDSAISSPLASSNDSVNGNVIDGDNDRREELDDVVNQRQIINGKKRKRSLIDGDDLSGLAQVRSRRQRTGSVQSESSIRNKAKSEEGSLSSQEGILEPTKTKREAADNAEANEDDAESDQEHIPAAKDERGKVVAGRRRVSRRKAIDNEVPVEEDNAEQQDAESEVEEAVENEEVDDAEAAAKSEEELAKKLAAMEALTNLEKHFATLRDRLYDERIVSINSELSQLASKKPTHPELLRQLKIIERHRDDKYDIEQKLLVHRVGALKRKSIAERAEIHSSYFQTARDLREKHLEKISEHFYRIQRERFKTEDTIPSYTIPFPKDHAQQVSHQVAYNKEVSILSGVAKYVGFPAAPELANIRASELDHDLAKMRILPNSAKTAAQPIPSAFTATLSRPAAEEHFLEHTPWANPQHPLSQQLQRISRQASEHSLVQRTPAVQRAGESMSLQNSASTIPEPNNSAAASSAFNTPFGDEVIHAPLENGDNRQPYRVQSASPNENRKVHPSHGPAIRAETAAPDRPKPELTPGSSLLRSRAAAAMVSPRSTPVILNSLPQHENVSPLDTHQNSAGILASGMDGLGRFGIR